jgi:phosphoesterase RecJ-like protein
MPTKSDGSSIILETPMGIEADDYSDRFDAIQELIDKAPCVVLVRHISPDSDAIGSVSAFAAALRTRYGENKKIIVSSEGSSVDPGQNGLVIYLDLGDADRVAGSLSGTYRTARIDHHPSSLQVDADASDDKAGSTCELLTLFLRTEGYGISKGMAASLLKGMAADNGRFEYNMSKSALVAAGILQDSGVDSKKLFGRMDSQSPSDAKARAFILNNYKRTKNGVAYIFVDDEVARKNGIPLESAASMAYELVKIRGCRIGALLIGRHGKINGRLRSQSIDITPVASKYGGGGHANACGVSVPDARTAIAMIRDLDALAANVKGQSLKESENIDEGVDAGFGILDAAVESLMHESIDADASEDIHMENNEITAISLIEGKLPDDPAKREYGVPEEKKFPLCDKAHVLSAIRFFNYVKPAHEKELASAIVSKMKAYDISFDSVGEDNRLRKYLPKSALKESENLEEILIRSSPFWPFPGL